MRLHWGEIVRFGITGAGAAAVHYGVYLAALRALSPTWAYALGYGVSFLFNFFGSALFTFGKQPSWRRLMRFVGCHVVNYLLQMALFKLWAMVSAIPREALPVFVLAIAVPVNYCLVRKAFADRCEK